ncbi:MAG: SIMPL domain-containing protein [Longimicrobiales bacterium]|nr:SIMPL domain-containing protein [Longimicrobiales bacterium]
MTPIRRAFMTPALLAALASCGGQPVSAQAPTPEPLPFVEVSGSATVSVAPDRVRVAFAVETRSATAAEAAARNAELMDAVIRALRASGIQGVDVETFGYTLRPEYAYAEAQPPQSPVIDGYTALNNVRATAGDVAAAGRLVDAAIRAGANRVSFLAFEASDTEAARREALTQAVQRATAQAEIMARALGRVLGAALEVRGGAAEQDYPRGVARARFLAQEAVDTPIEAGDLTVSASVTIRFALGGAVEGR